MRLPPKLSKRELQVLPFLVQGYTRREIADELQVSDETVKIFARNLSRKFGGSTVREVMRDLVDYHKFFLKGAYKFYVPHVDFFVEVSENLQECSTKAKFSIVPITDEVNDFIECYAIRSDLCAIEINKRLIRGQQDIENKILFKYEFERPIKPFEQQEIEVISQQKLTYPNGKKTSYSNAAFEPTGSMDFRVKFANRQPPSKVVCYRRHGSQIYQNEFDYNIIGETTYQLKIQNPIHLSCYTLEWEI